MLAVGIIILLISSIIRGWGMLNYRRGPADAALIASPTFLAMISIGSIILGLIGSIIIGFQSGFLVSLLAFGAFWFLSGIWSPILASIGL